MQLYSLLVIMPISGLLFT